MWQCTAAPAGHGSAYSPRQQWQPPSAATVCCAAQCHHVWQCNHPHASLADAQCRTAAADASAHELPDQAYFSRTQSACVHMHALHMTPSAVRLYICNFEVHSTTSRLHSALPCAQDARLPGCAPIAGSNTYICPCTQYSLHACILNACSIRPTPVAARHTKYKY